MTPRDGVRGSLYPYKCNEPLTPSRGVTTIKKEKIQKLSTELEESKTIIAAYKPSIWERISEFIKGKLVLIRSGQVLVDNLKISIMRFKIVSK